MKKRKSIFLVVAMLVFGLVLTACGSNSSQSNASASNGSSSNSSSSSKSTSGSSGNSSSSTASSSSSSSSAKGIIVASGTTFPPFEELKNNTPEGFDIAMIKAIAKKENIKIDQLKPMTFNGIIPALQNGQVDVAVAGITIKKDRMKTVNFSNAYYKSGLSILVKKGSTIKSLSDLKGHLVATKKGTSSVDFLKQHGFKDNDIKQFAHTNTAYQTLMSGGADAVVFDNPVNINFAKKHNNVAIVGGLLTGEYYGIAISKKAPKTLVKKINAGLAAIKKDGTYKDLFNKYLGGNMNGIVNSVKKPANVAVSS